MTIKLYHKGKPEVITNVRSVRERITAYRIHVNGGGSKHYAKKDTNRIRVTADVKS